MTYIPPHIPSIVSDWDKGERTGETTHIKILDKNFKWMRGHQTGIYGWPNDGKGLWTDYITVVKAAKEKDWRACFFKPEDMNAERVNGKLQITANNIYKKLLWTYTGKCPIKAFCAQMDIKQIPLEEEMEAMRWVQDHFKVVYLKEKTWPALLQAYREQYDIFGISCFVTDPWTSLILDESKRGDLALRHALSEGKEFAMETDSSMLYVNHPVQMREARVSKDGPYKIVNQYMIAGGPTWDRAMDSQASCYRPNRHDPKMINDPQMHYYSLKQRDDEFVLAFKGEIKNIMLDKKQRRYYFDEVCPMTGAKFLHPGQVETGSFDFTKKYSIEPKIVTDDDMPF